MKVKRVSIALPLSTNRQEHFVTVAPYGINKTPVIWLFAMDNTARYQPVKTNYREHQTPVGAYLTTAYAQIGGQPRNFTALHKATLREPLKCQRLY